MRLGYPVVSRHVSMDLVVALGARCLAEAVKMVTASTVQQPSAKPEHAHRVVPTIRSTRQAACHISSTRPVSAWRTAKLICAYLDHLDGKPRFHHPLRESDWAYRQLEANARSMYEVVARSQRMADLFEARISDPLMGAGPGMGHLTVDVYIVIAREQGRGYLTC